MKLFNRVLLALAFLAATGSASYAYTPGGVTQSGVVVATHCAEWSGNNKIQDSGTTCGGSGTVTSVALTMPGIFGITGSPITTSGTLGVTLNTEAAKTVLAGPTSGVDATPTFRQLVCADLSDAASGCTQDMASWTGTTSLNTVGTITSGIWHGAAIGINYGGTGVDLSATGGAHEVLKQSTLGGLISVGQLACADLSDAGAGCSSSSATPPGGLTTQLQYNNAGAFGGIAGVTSDGTVITVAAGDLKLAGSGGTSQVLQQTTVGGAVTVGQLACADLSDAASGCSTAALTVGGSTTQVQYNNAGTLGGIAGATTNGTVLTLASGDLQLSGSTSGTTTITPAATGGGTLTLPAGSHTLAAIDLAQTWSAAQSFNSGDFKLNGSGSGAVTLNAPATGGSTLTLPTGSDTLAGLAQNETWTGNQTFTNGAMILNGAVSGNLTLKAAASGISNTLTFPSGTTDFTATGGTSEVLKQISHGAAITVGQLACADLSDAGAGCTGSGGLSPPIPLSDLASQAGDTVVMNDTTTSGTPTAVSVPACTGSANAIQYQSGGVTPGWKCGAITATATPGGVNTQLQYNNAGAMGGVPDITYDGTNLVISSVSGLLTMSTPSLTTIGNQLPFDLESTWNNAAVAFSGLHIQVTDTASAATSTLADFLNSSNSAFFNINKDGTVTFGTATGGPDPSITFKSSSAGNTNGTLSWPFSGTGSYSVTLPGYSGALVAGSSSPAQGDILYYNGSQWTDLAPGTSGFFLKTNGASANPSWASASGSGTVTSVGLSLPSIFSVSGSPVTTTGTLTGTLATESANTIFAGPTTGAAAAPTFRSLVLADLPASIPLSGLAAQAADTLVANASGVSAVPTAVAFPTTGTNGCAGASNALIYNTTTHALGCNTISASATDIAVGTTTVSSGTSGFILYDNAGVLGDLATTGSGSVVLATTPTITTPVLNGTVTGTGVSTSASASTLGQRDTNSNFFANNLLANATLTTSAGGTTTLTAASSRYQALTGSSAQTYQLPNATTLSLGPWFTFNDNSSGALTVTNAGASTIFTVPAGGVTQCGPTNIGTSNGTWDCHSFLPSTVSWGTGTVGLYMNNALSTTPAISAGASSCSAPAFQPQRTAATTGWSGDGTKNCVVIGGSDLFDVTSSGISSTGTASFGAAGVGGATANAATAALLISTGTPTTAANGLQFGSDTSANLYRYSSGVVASDGYIFGRTGLSGTTVQANTIYPLSTVDLVMETRPGTSKNIIFKSIGTTPTESGRFDTNGNFIIGSMQLTDNYSGSGIYGTTGAYMQSSGTLTDTTSTGTVATAYGAVLGNHTWAASSATTITNAFADYVKAPVAGTNVTLTNNYAFGADSIYDAGSLFMPGSSSGLVTLNAPATGGGTLTLPTGTDTIVGRASTDTLTNKTISGSSNTITNLSGSNISSGTVASTYLPTDVVYYDQNQSFTKAQRATPVTISISTSTFTPNFDTGQNFTMTLVHASCPCTLANPSTTPVAGQSGILVINQSATGSDTIGTWGSDYIYPGGTSTIALSTGASAIDVFSYYVIDSTHILLSTGALNATH